MLPSSYKYLNSYMDISIEEAEFVASSYLPLFS